MLNFDVMLPDIGRVAVRPLKRGDEATVQQVFDGLSDLGRFYRFHQATPVLPAAMRRLLADVDGSRHRAAAVWHDGRPVGTVRIVGDVEGDAELAVTIVDEFQGMGLGTIIVDRALLAAERAQIPCLRVFVHAQNRAAVGLFRKFGFGFVRDGTALLGTRPGSLVQAA